jgi:mannosyltransferase OCH1-like enzyme
VAIPRVFHQVWLGPDPFPGRYERYQQTWLDHHPGWQLRFWTEDTLPDQLRRPEAAERLRSPAERADILRLEVVWRHGGVYLDPYFECLRPIDELIADTDLFAVQARSGRPTNTLFGATAQHPLLDQALDRIQPRAFPGYDETATGRRFFEHLLADQPTLTLLDSNLFYPRTTKKLEHAHATSHELRPWKSLVEARKALMRAERRHQDARYEIGYWRQKYEEAAGGDAGAKQQEPGVDDGRAGTSALRIPRIFHQIWLGPDPLPEEYRRYQQTWLDHHPSWELRFWTEDDLPEQLRRTEAAQKLRNASERSNFLRLEVVWRYGGVYLDTDFECLRSLEPLIEDAEFFIGLVEPDRANNALFGAIADHPILDHALDEIQPREFYGYSQPAGPKFLDRIVAEHRDDVLFLAPEVLYPNTPEKVAEAYAVHHPARVWKDVEVYWLDMVRAQQRMEHKMEEKLELALEDARHWRARSQAAEAELDRLKRSRRVSLRRLG